MNEKIKELAEQARKYADENRSGSFVKYDPEWFILYNEKLAELIVRECAGLMDGRRIEYGNCKDGRVILKHFGVEE
jgi:hypothetical protein